MLKKLLFVLVFFSFCLKPFAQSNPYLILENKEAEKRQQEQKAAKQKARKAAKEQTNNQAFNSPEKKDTVIHQSSTKTKAIEIGAGGLYTSLNFFKNAQAFTYYPASSFRLYLQPNNFVQFVLDYSHVKQVNIVPTWLNVQNTYIDFDAHFLMHPDKADRTLVYFVLGVSSQIWKGLYTGIDDYNYALLHIPHNTNYKAIYYGASIGVGFEFKVINRVNLYGEVRYRMTQTDVGFGLSDVCYGAGVKYTLVDFHPKPIYNKPGKHFHWF
ncbi:MAG TPA: hypothetical protein VK835_12845 [Bacteroidia bacterium]|jgi:hypothetical protein|nr:hypothetical protein [Bacteroidia bacterium]